jgi:hypothetical protein
MLKWDAVGSKFHGKEIGHGQGNQASETAEGLKAAEAP